MCLAKIPLAQPGPSAFTSISVERDASVLASCLRGMLLSIVVPHLAAPITLLPFRCYKMTCFGLILSMVMDSPALCWSDYLSQLVSHVVAAVA